MQTIIKCKCGVKIRTRLVHASKRITCPKCGASKVLKRVKKTAAARHPCPACKTTNLHEKHHQESGVDIDVCSKCKGVWLDKDELQEFVSVPGTKDTAKLLKRMFTGGRLSDRPCPKCKIAMKQAAADSSGTLVERCSRCTGLWFDSGEIQSVVEFLKKADPYDRCSECRGHMPKNAVLCIQCGFDSKNKRFLMMRAGDEIMKGEAEPSQPKRREAGVFLRIMFLFFAVLCFIFVGKGILDGGHVTITDKRGSSAEVEGIVGWFFVIIQLGVGSLFVWMGLFVHRPRVVMTPQEDELRVSDGAIKARLEGMSGAYSKAIIVDVAAGMIHFLHCHQPRALLVFATDPVFSCSFDEVLAVKLKKESKYFNNSYTDNEFLTIVTRGGRASTSKNSTTHYGVLRQFLVGTLAPKLPGSFLDGKIVDMFNVLGWMGGLCLGLALWLSNLDSESAIFYVLLCPVIGILIVRGFVRLFERAEYGC